MNRSSIFIHTIFIKISSQVFSQNLVLCFQYLATQKHFFFQAARETGALKEAKDKLEKKVEELTWRIQLEKRLRVILSYFNIKFDNICHRLCFILELILG